MNKSMKIVRSASVVAALVALTLPAFGAGWGWDRDAGAKARGEFGYNGTRSHSQRTYSRNYTYGYSNRLSEPVVESRRSFSYEPALAADIKVGDTVVVTADSAQLMLGHNALANVPKGKSLLISDVQGTWLGTHLQSNDQNLAGWISADDVAR